MVDDNGGLNNETAWFLSVGRELARQGKHASIHAEYLAAAVGTRSAKAVIARLYREKSMRTHSETIFTPSAVTRADSAVPYSAERSGYRAMRRAIEEHCCGVGVLVGALFVSLRAFKLANTVLSMETQTARDAAGHTRRHRVRTSLCNVTMPRFFKVESFTKDIVAWATSRIPMGSRLSTPQIIYNDLAQALLILLA